MIERMISTEQNEFASEDESADGCFDAEFVAEALAAKYAAEFFALGATGKQMQSMGPMVHRLKNSLLYFYRQGEEETLGKIFLSAEGDMTSRNN